MREGKFWGLSTIDRTGETSFTVDPVGGVIELSGKNKKDSIFLANSIVATLSLSRPSAHYKAHADFMGIGVSVHLNSIYIPFEMNGCCRSPLMLILTSMTYKYSWMLQLL